MVAYTSAVIWDEHNQLFELTIAAESRETLVVNIKSNYSAAFQDIQLLGAFLYGDLPQSQIINLRTGKSSPIGYIFNLSKAFERDSTQPEVRWFNGVAISAAFWALSNLHQSTLKQIYERGQPEISHQEIFIDSACIAVFKKVESAVIGLNSFEQIDHQIYSLGFERKWRGDEEISKPHVTGPDHHPANRNVLLNIIPIQTKRLRFISDTFTRHIPSSDHPLMQFFFYYQLIELMLEEISAQRIAESYDRLMNSRGSTSFTQVRDEAQRLQTAMKEASNVNQLFSITGLGVNEMAKLKALLIAALDPTNTLQGNSLADYIYQLRNQLFHNYRESESTAEQHLDNINSELRQIIPDLLSSIFVKNSHQNIRGVRDTLALSSVFELNFVHLLRKSVHPMHG